MPVNAGIQSVDKVNDLQTLKKPGSSRATAFMHPSPQDAVTGCPLLDLKSQWAGRYMLCMERLL